ncbi:MAG: sugar ABC transporter permease [Clostridiaceae bacterium]
MHTGKICFNIRSMLLGMLPAVLLYVAMGLGPSIATFILSFTDISGIAGVPWKFIGLANYKEFFVQQNQRDLLQVIKNTVEFCILVTVIQNAVALAIAIVLNKKDLKRRNFYRAVIFLPVVLGALVTSLTWLTVLNPLGGPAESLLRIFGMSSGFFTANRQALEWTIFCQIWMAMGYSMVINLAGLQSIPTELYEAGEIDGASKWNVFRYITFPMLWPTINVNLVLAVIGSLQSFQIILFTTGGKNMFTQTMAARVMFYGFNINAGSGAVALRQGFGATWAMVLFVFILSFTLLYQRLMKGRNSEI